MVGFVYNFTAAVEAKNVVADATRSTRFHLVFVAEQFLSRETSSVVQLAVR